MTGKRCQLRQEVVGRNIERSTKQVSYELTYDILLRTNFYFLFTQFVFGIRSSEVMVSLVSIRCFCALKFSLAKMASESVKSTSQNGIFTSR